MPKLPSSTFPSDFFITYSDFNDAFYRPSRLSGWGQVLTATNSVGTTTYSWSDNGNLESKENPSAEVTQYSYNFENRLVSILYPGGATNAFGYDTQGIRTFKEDSEGLHSYLIDKVSVLAEFNGLGGMRAWYNANPMRIDEILSQVQTSGKYFHLVDGLGSVYGLVNQGQAKVASYSYDAYGALTDAQVQPGVENPFLFTGRELDGDSGLQYNRARYYLSGVGSWNREDPIKEKFNSMDSSLLPANFQKNAFRYTNSPTIFTDPSGLLLRFNGGAVVVGGQVAPPLFGINLMLISLYGPCIGGKQYEVRLLVFLFGVMWGFAPFSFYWYDVSLESRSYGPSEAHWLHFLGGAIVVSVGVAGGPGYYAYFFAINAFRTPEDARHGTEYGFDLVGVEAMLGVSIPLIPFCGKIDCCWE